MKRIIYGLAAAALGLLLSACGGDTALSDLQLSRSVVDLANGEEALVSYRIGAPATVSIWLTNSAGERFVLRDAVAREPSDDAYQLTFDGSAQIDADTRQVLPDGEYTLTIAATPEGGAAQELSAPLRLTNAPAEPFDVFDLAVTPNPFSPDEDAIDDITNFTYRLPISATVTIDILAPDGQRYPFIARAERGPGEHTETWSGRPVAGGFLPAGDYQYELTAEDGRGNRVTKRDTVTIASAGVGQMVILSADITPTSLERGGTITVTFEVQNTGDVGIRTHGPPSGWAYNTHQTYASVADERYANKGGGLWRVGVDWEGNGGAGSRYPFRWAVSPRPPEEWTEPGEFDILRPGETATITGTIQLLEFENRMTFFVGLAHEGVDYPYDRLNQTLVEVDF